MGSGFAEPSSSTAYAYGTHVGVTDDDGSSVGEGIAIHASSEWYDVSKTLGIDRTADGKYAFFDDHYAVLPAQAENGIFLGLQRSTGNLPEELRRAVPQTLGSREFGRAVAAKMRCAAPL